MKRATCVPMPHTPCITTRDLDGSAVVAKLVGKILSTISSVQTSAMKTLMKFFRAESSKSTKLWIWTIKIAALLRWNAHHTGTQIQRLKPVTPTTLCTALILMKMPLFSMKRPEKRASLRDNTPNPNNASINALCPSLNSRTWQNMLVNFLFLLRQTTTPKTALITAWELTHQALTMFQAMAMKPSISKWVLPLLQALTRLSPQTPTLWAWSSMRIALWYRRILLDLIHISRRSYASIEKLLSHSILTKEKVANLIKLSQ